MFIPVMPDQSPQEPPMSDFPMPLTGAGATAAPSFKLRELGRRLG